MHREDFLKKKIYILLVSERISLLYNSMISENILIKLDKFSIGDKPSSKSASRSYKSNKFKLDILSYYFIFYQILKDHSIYDLYLLRLIHQKIL